MSIKIQTQQKWQEIILAQKASGLGPQKFCQENNINQPSFYRWRKHFRIADEATGTTLVAMSSGESEQPGSLTKGFVRLIPPKDPPEIICIDTPNGYQVKIGQVGEGGLRNVLEVLRAL
jgi:hypothetical protein